MTQPLPSRPHRDPLPTRESLQPDSPAPPKPARLASLDAYRGAIMLLMASGGLALGQVAREHFSGDHLWQVLAFQTDHVEWAGGTLRDAIRPGPGSADVNRLGGWFGGSIWDLIQPSFMFMVGVAMPFSYAARWARGDSNLRVWLHVLGRSLVLVALGIFLRSKNSPQTNFTFEDVLTQIGLGYPFVFLVFVVGRKLGAWFVVYLLAAAAAVAGYWAYFYYYPLPPAGFDYASVGLSDGPWPWKEGLFAHWDKNTNAAHWFDVWFLNLFPRASEWKFNGGGYLTLNFVPSMATAIFGLMAGELLRGPRGKGFKFLALVLLGAACLAAGIYAHETVNPIVKRIWTPAWAVYSAGWTFLLLALFYGIIDGIGLRAWAFPLVVVGMNSIAMYCMAGLIGGWVREQLKIHAGKEWFAFAGAYGPIAQSAAVLSVLWLVCLWLYRRGIFIRI